VNDAFAGPERLRVTASLQRIRNVTTVSIFFEQQVSDGVAPDIR
jgi:hypothetical protein